MNEMNMRKQRGVAVIELAILLVPLIILTFGMTELGRAVHYYNGIVSSTRAAARYLSTVPEGQGEDGARCVAVYGNPGCSGTPLVPGLTTGMVQIRYQHGVEAGPGTVEMVRVTVEGYPFRSMVPFVVRDMTFASIGTSMRQPVA